MSAADLMDFSPEVAEARSARKPLVALESTIITHGMPYPRNVETALAVEQAAREMGAVPATIAVIEGRFRIGLDERGDRPAWPARRRRREGLAARSGAGRRAQRLGRHDSRGDNVHRRPRGRSKSSPPAESAASIAAPRRHSTSPPISSSFRAPASRSSAPAPNQFSTSGKHSSFSKLKGSRSSATAPTSSRPSTPAPPVSSSNIAATGFTISPA